MTPFRIWALFKFYMVVSLGTIHRVITTWWLVLCLILCLELSAVLWQSSTYGIGNSREHGMEKKYIFRSPLVHKFLSFFVIVTLRSMHLLTYKLQGLVTLRSEAIAMFMPTFICNGYVFLYFLSCLGSAKFVCWNFGYNWLSPKKLGLNLNLFVLIFTYPYIVFHPPLENPSTDTHVPLPWAIPPLCILYTPKPRLSTNSLVKFVNTNPPGHNPSINFQAPTQLILYIWYPLYTSVPYPLLRIPYTYPFIFILRLSY